MKENFSKSELRVIKGLVDSRLSRLEYELTEDFCPKDKNYINSCISKLMIIRDKLDNFLWNLL